MEEKEEGEGKYDDDPKASGEGALNKTEGLEKELYGLSAAAAGGAGGAGGGRGTARGGGGGGGGRGADASSSAYGNGDDGGLGVVRVKPLGAGGGGGGEASAAASPPQGSVTYSTDPPSLTVGGRNFTYPSHVISPEMDQQATWTSFMPPRVQAFLDGMNVNVMAYGQTGSGKTHTMFGPPGIMARAGAGEYGDDLCPDYGLFPRGLLAVFEACDALRRSGVAVVLTASAVELSHLGNADMLARAEEMAQRQKAADKAGGIWQEGALGVSLDKAAQPPRLYGMTEFPLNHISDLRTVYAALARRNTAATLMNNSSSRTHCFAFLTLRTHDPVGDKVRMSRFQFVDLAGSERIKDAHGDVADWSGGGQAVTGLLTNFSLTMLGQCARALVEHNRRKGKKSKFSFRAYLFDMVMLLQESMTGRASTACFVCVSQAPDNLGQSKFALDFGEAFSNLSPRPSPVKPEPRKKLLQAAENMLAEAERVLARGGGGKFRFVREAQKRDAEQQIALLAQLAPG